MITEFVGISGVGKSTLSRSYYTKKKECNEKIEWPRNVLYNEYSWFKRNFKKSVDVLLFSILNFRWVKSLFRVIIKAGVCSNKERIVLLFNGIHLKQMILKCNSYDIEYMFDEGVFQFIWSIYLRSDSTPTTYIIKEILSYFYIPDKLVFVDADSNIIEERLHKRGTNTKIMENDELVLKITQMKQVLRKIVDIAVDEHLLDADQIEYKDNNQEISQ